MNNQIFTCVVSEGQHNYHKKYSEHSIVTNTIDAITKTYVSLKDVPQFVSILDKRYWKEVEGKDMKKYIDDEIERITGIIDHYHKGYTGYVIDQRGVVTAPASMCSVNVLVNDEHYAAAKEGTLNIGDLFDSADNLGTAVPIALPYKSDIEWLKEHSHCYVGVYDGTKMTLKQLDDNDRTKYADGSSAATDIAKTVDGSNSYDVWMKFETDVYYRSFPLIPYGEHAANTDLQLILISKDVPADAEEWEKWDKNKMIGVYEGYVSDSKLYSTSDKIATNAVSQADFKTYARSRGTGFKLVDYQAHQLMALLFYGEHNTLDCQTVCGSGTKNDISSIFYPKKTGLCNSLGMRDTNSTNGNGAASPATAQIYAGEGANIKSINFWGLENWWGDINEWIDNLSVMVTRRSSDSDDADPDLYVADYITKYLEDNPSATGVIITENGVDKLVTQADIDDTSKYATAQAFIAIRDINGVITRIIKSVTINTSNSGANMTKMQFGDHCDANPKAASGTTHTTYYCDYVRVVASAGVIAARSYSSASANGGVGYLHLYHGAAISISAIGSRLLFEGNSNNIVISD